MNGLLFFVIAVRSWLHTLEADKVINPPDMKITDIPFKVLTVMMYGEDIMNKKLEDIRELFQLHNEALAGSNSILPVCI